MRISEYIHLVLLIISVTNVSYNVHFQVWCWEDWEREREQERASERNPPGISQVEWETRKEGLSPLGGSESTKPRSGKGTGLSLWAKGCRERGSFNFWGRTRFSESRGGYFILRYLRRLDGTHLRGVTGTLLLLSRAPYEELLENQIATLHLHYMLCLEYCPLK